MLNDFGGVLVANTDQGVRDGLQAALDGRLVVGTLDIERYNAEAVERFRQVVRPAGRRA